MPLSSTSLKTGHLGQVPGRTGAPPRTAGFSELCAKTFVSEKPAVATVAAVALVAMNCRRLRGDRCIKIRCLLMQRYSTRKANIICCIKQQPQAQHLSLGIRFVT